MTLVDEWPQLVPDRYTRAIAQQAKLMETWLQDKKLPLLPLPYEAIVHGHCHQKAIVGLDGTLAALGRIPDLKVMPLDTGCCGMAGAFGYEKKHYQLSMGIAQSVVKQIAQHPEAILVANGTSCRHQLKDCGIPHALHPVQLLAKQLAR